tara:strand:+ start:15722 stop:16642 length:921 start_codon:yes stop_codon:yes gene_type:complete
MITHLVFSGSNIYGLPYIGVLRYLYTHSLHNNIKHVAGTSFGASIATLFALKVDIETIEKIFHDFFSDKNICNISPDKVINIIPKLGLDTTYKYMKWNIEYIKNNYDIHNLTFSDISKINGINLYINAFCINTQSEFVFSVDSTPDVCIIDALCASMSLPILYQPVEINGYYYCDNCFFKNTPVSYFSNINPKHILSVITDNPIVNDIIPKNTLIDFFTFIIIIISVIFNFIFEYSSVKYISDNTIVIDQLNDISIKINKKGIYFDVSEVILNNAILFGFHKTQKFFDNYYQTIGSSPSSNSTEVV